jgi:hypothetical protein
MVNGIYGWISVIMAMKVSQTSHPPLLLSLGGGFIVLPITEFGQSLGAKKISCK